MLTRDSILQADDLRRELVKVPEWGGEVYVRVMTGTERDRLEQTTFANRKPGDTVQNIRAAYAAYSVCDESGTLIFTPADIVARGQKCAAALDRVFEVSQRLNRISAKDVEELKGN